MKKLIIVFALPSVLLIAGSKFHNGKEMPVERDAVKAQITFYQSGEAEITIPSANEKGKLFSISAAFTVQVDSTQGRQFFIEFVTKGKNQRFEIYEPANRREITDEIFNGK